MILDELVTAWCSSATLKPSPGNYWACCVQAGRLLGQSVKAIVKHSTVTEIISMVITQITVNQDSVMRFNCTSDISFSSSLRYECAVDLADCFNSTTVNIYL